MLNRLSNPSKAYLTVLKSLSNAADFSLTQPDFWSNSEFRQVTEQNRRKNTQKITLTTVGSSGDTLDTEMTVL